MACKSFNTKKQSEELAIGMVAHNEVLEQLGHKVREQDLISKIAARERAERPWRPAPNHPGIPFHLSILAARWRQKAVPSLRRRIVAGRQKRVHTLWCISVPSKRRNLPAQGERSQQAGGSSPQPGEGEFTSCGKFACLASGGTCSRKQEN